MNETPKFSLGGGGRGSGDSSTEYDRLVAEVSGRHGGGCGLCRSVL